LRGVKSWSWSSLQVRNLTADREAMLEEAAAASESVGAAQETVTSLEGEVKTLEAKVASHKAKYDEALAALEDRRARAAACDKEVGALSKEKAKLAKKLADANVDIRKAELKLGRMEKEAAEAENRVVRVCLIPHSSLIRRLFPLPLCVRLQLGAWAWSGSILVSALPDVHESMSCVDASTQRRMRTARRCRRRDSRGDLVCGKKAVGFMRRTH